MTGPDIVHHEPHRFMTVSEVADALRLSRATIYRMINTGRLPGMRLGRSMRVSRAVVEQLIHDSEPPQLRARRQDRQLMTSSRRAAAAAAGWCRRSVRPGVRRRFR